MENQEKEELLNAVEEIMILDKGPSEEEWVEWCNKYLRVMKRNGRMKNTVSFH